VSPIGVAGGAGAPTADAIGRGSAGDDGDRRLGGVIPPMGGVADGSAGIGWSVVCIISSDEF
jgi:hypothetical protein